MTILGKMEAACRAVRTLALPAVASDYARLLRRPLLKHPDGLLEHFLFGPDATSVYG